MNTFFLYPDENSKPSYFDIAVENIKKGELVVFPTETVYGIGANAFSTDSCEKIYRTKNRPSNNPLIIHIADFSMIDQVCDDDMSIVKPLFEKFSPGPFTLIAKKKKEICDEATAGIQTAAIRIPSHPIAHAFLKAVNIPIAAPSANISKRPSPSTFAMATYNMNQKVSTIIDGGDCSIGIESTIVRFKVDHLEILRPGILTKEEFEKVTGIPTVYAEAEANVSPGTRHPHYMPEKNTYMISPENLKKLNEQQTKNSILDHTFFLTMQKTNLPYQHMFSSYEDYIKNIYKVFFACDQNPEIRNIVCETVDASGIGIALFDRIYRSSQGLSFPY